MTSGQEKRKKRKQPQNDGCLIPASFSIMLPSLQGLIIISERGMIWGQAGKVGPPGSKCHSSITIIEEREGKGPSGHPEGFLW
jgi:hypothetical protein